MQIFSETRRSISSEASYKKIKQYINDDIIALSSYIAKQKTTLGSYADYITSCVELGLDLTRKKNKYPNDFMHWHDVRIDEYHSKMAETDSGKHKELYDRFTEIADKYHKLQYDKTDGFICIIAKTPMDLKKESFVLKHCVGKLGYDMKHSREETLIFFVRSKESPSVPLYTIEYSPTKKKILQCQGLNHILPQNEAYDYVYKTWLPYANKIMRRIAA